MRYALGEGPRGTARIILELPIAARVGIPRGSAHRRSALARRALEKRKNAFVN